MYLPDNIFSTVIESAPLVSIDLIVQDQQGRILLGMRKNRPAQGYWFVPGGRILKNESLSGAFMRVTLFELGQSYSINDAILQGPYDHFYKDSVFGEPPSTHYVAIAYKLIVTELSNLPSEQHSNYRWFEISELLDSSEVHRHTKAYF